MGCDFPAEARGQSHPYGPAPYLVRFVPLGPADDG